MPRVRSKSCTAVVLALVCGACAAAGLGAVANIALTAARKTFLGVATENYGESYRDDFDRLLTVLTKPLSPGETTTVGTTSGAPADASTPAPDASAGAASGAPATDGSNAASGVPAAVAGASKLALEVAIMREEIVDGRSIPVPVQDGETLYDRFGAHGDGDLIKFSFRTNADCYVYVIAIDGTGWVQAVFPSNYAGFTNPVKAHQLYLFPEGANWIQLDSYRGVEHLYFLASQTQRPDLEQALTAIAAHVREEDKHRAAAPSDALAMAHVTEAAPVARGFDRVTLSKVTDVQAPTGETHSVDAQLFASHGEGDILVTRWFRHQ